MKDKTVRSRNHAVLTYVGILGALGLAVTLHQIFTAPTPQEPVCPNVSVDTALAAELGRCEAGVDELLAVIDGLVSSSSKCEDEKANLEDVVRGDADEIEDLRYLLDDRPCCTHCDACDELTAEDVRRATEFVEAQLEAAAQEEGWDQ